MSVLEPPNTRDLEAWRLTLVDRVVDGVLVHAQ